MLLAGWLILVASGSYSQCVVTRDAKDRIITICQVRAPADGFLQNRPDFNSGIASREVYAGSPYVSFPVWQPGTLELDHSDQSIACQLAYNLTTNQVLSRFGDNLEEHVVLPQAFTLNGTRFISLKPSRNRLYYRVLYGGNLQVLKHTRCRLQKTTPESTQRNDNFDGHFRCQSSYYVKRANQSLQRVSLSRKSLLRAFPELVGELAGFPKQKLFSETDLIEMARLQDVQPKIPPVESPVPDSPKLLDSILL